MLFGHGSLDGGAHVGGALGDFYAGFFEGGDLLLLRSEGGLSFRLGFLELGGGLFLGGILALVLSFIGKSDQQS